MLVATGVACGLLTRPVFLPPPELPLVYTMDSVGPPRSVAPIEIWRPEGPGPFPAVILLHGCGGGGYHEHIWAERVVGWGYIAVIPNSYVPRHIKGSCGYNIVSLDVRIGDLLNLTAFMRTQLGIPADRTGVIGFSAGGTAALAVASETAHPPFRAIVGYYSYCGQPPKPNLAADALILLGGADHEELKASCAELRAAQAGTPHPVEIKMFPEAIHNFDIMKGNAAPASFVDTEAFLAAHFKAR
jgi:dienelactone hydrolase